MTDENFDDVRRVISLCFRGFDSISDLDLERILSFDMEWLSPEEAETAVSNFIDKGWLTGGRDKLSPAFDTKSVTTPIGWFPRPSRLLQPVDFEKQETVEEPKILHKESKVELVKGKNNPKSASNLDPREKLANRLKKYIARQSKIPLDEIERRTDRKQKALNYASNWLCLALIAREQNLEMEQIITALSG